MSCDNKDHKEAMAIVQSVANGAFWASQERAKKLLAKIEARDQPKTRRKKKDDCYTGTCEDWP